MERARDTYSFSHLTFQEYLTAQHVAQQPDLMQALVHQHLTDERWREVFLLVTGCLSNANPLLELMAAKTPTLLATDNLKDLVNWADTATAGSLGDYKPAAKRAAALFFALALAIVLVRFLARSLVRALTFALARSLAFTLDRSLTLALDRSLAFALDRSLAISLGISLALDISSEFEKIKIFQQVDFTGLTARLSGLKARVPEGEISDEIYQKFEQQLVQIWCGALHLQPDWLELSEQEANSLENYLSANLLLLKCKEAAVRVSQQTWAGIEQRMLTVEDRTS